MAHSLEFILTMIQQCIIRESYDGVGQWISQLQTTTSNQDSAAIQKVLEDVKKHIEDKNLKQDYIHLLDLINEKLSPIVKRQRLKNYYDSK